MRSLLGFSLVLTLLSASLAREPAPAPGPALIEGVKGLRSVVVGSGGKVYMAVAGAGKGSGTLQLVENGKATSVAKGFDAPSSLAFFGEAIYVADGRTIQRVDVAGKVTQHVGPDAFPGAVTSLETVVAGEKGELFVLDQNEKLDTFAIYRISAKGKVSPVTDSSKTVGIKRPRGMTLDSSSFLLLVDSHTGKLHRVKMADGTSTVVAEGLGTGGSLAWDWFGRLYVGASKAGETFVIGRAGEKPVVAATGAKWLQCVAMGPNSRTMLLVDSEAGSIRAIPVGVPGKPVNETPLPFKTEVAFPNLKWTDWKSEDSAGKPVPLRPIVLTHANDGSNRVFVATEHGVIHAFANDPKADKTSVFLDIQDRVVYDDKQNEEGLLGLAFSPKFKENGEFYVYYTRKEPKLTNVISRFRVKKDNPNQADPASEEELLRMTKPFWNHNGGTLVFGPDGYLYVAVGDGGKADDPFEYGQNLGVLFGKVLRLDVSRKGDGKPYAIPADNPFVGKENVRPEIYAYGVRNPWRITFDRKTGKLWLADVGQNLYEEINLVTPGGNLGWNLRESLHPFGAKGVGPQSNLIEPIWEYHHDLGKSITGGHVYRGTRLPELQGAYLYADYVSSKIWALWYDEAQGRVVANRPIQDPGLAVLSFGEDEAGEVYFLVASVTGQGIYRFAPASK